MCTLSHPHKLFKYDIFGHNSIKVILCTSFLLLHLRRPLIARLVMPTLLTWLKRGPSDLSTVKAINSFVISSNLWCDTLRPCKHPVSQQPFIQWLQHDKPYLIKYYLRGTKWWSSNLIIPSALIRWHFSVKNPPFTSILPWYTHGFHFLLNCVMIHYYHYSVWCSSCPIFGQWGPHQIAPVSFWYNSIGSGTFPCFLEQENTLGSLCSCLAPDLKSTLLQGALLPFNEEWYLGRGTLFWGLWGPFCLLNCLEMQV